MNKITMAKKIKEGFEAYSLFVDKEIHYLYKVDGDYKEVVLKAKKEDFMHLCGVQYWDPTIRKKVTPNHFYRLVKDNKISAEHLIEKKDGSTTLKLRVIDCLKEVLTSNIRIVDKQVSFTNFTAAKSLRSRRQIFALALNTREKLNNNHYPVSLLDLKTTKADFLKPSYEVECIYSNSRKESIYIYYETESYQKYRLHQEFMELEKYEEKEKIDAK
ncbi:MAG: hypothetical protein H9W82_12185 [Lactobacillus sp.]|nr:hypothetical protein [Lactobacillus sp.]